MGRIYNDHSLSVRNVDLTGNVNNYTILSSIPVPILTDTGCNYFPFDGQRPRNYTYADPRVH